MTPRAHVTARATGTKKARDCPRAFPIRAQQSQDSASLSAACPVGWGRSELGGEAWPTLPTAGPHRPLGLGSQHPDALCPGCLSQPL